MLQCFFTDILFPSQRGYELSKHKQSYRMPIFSKKWTNILRILKRLMSSARPRLSRLWFPGHQNAVDDPSSSLNDTSTSAGTPAALHGTQSWTGSPKASACDARERFFFDFVNVYAQNEYIGLEEEEERIFCREKAPLLRSLIPLRRFESARVKHTQLS